MEPDLLDSVLDIEEQFYQEGYSQGVADGAQAGYAEGSVFAVEKGFEKFLEIGRLYGKALVWTQRLADNNHREDVESSSADGASTAGAEDSQALVKPVICKALPDLPNNARLVKNVQSLLLQVDPATLSLENTEDAVFEMDNRLKNASLKAKLIQRVLGEREDGHGDNRRISNQVQGGATGNIEEISSSGNDLMGTANTSALLREASFKLRAHYREFK